METFDLGLHRMARIWQGTFPEACFYASTTLKGALSVNVNRVTPIEEHQSFCIEYKVGLGGRIGYGLLGTTFAPARSKQLLFKVSVKDEAWTSFSTPLYQADTVYVGLPESLARWVLKGSCQYFTDRPVVGGELNFVAAAFSEAGSSPDIFRRLAAATCHYYATMANPDEIRYPRDFTEIFSIITTND